MVRARGIQSCPPVRAAVLARSVRHACTHGHRADTESDTAIPLPLVESPILSKVIEYCTWHVKAESDGTSKDAKNDWSAKFVDVDQGTLFHLILGCLSIIAAAACF